MARNDICFLHAERVRWGEADMQGVVFNAHYLTYVDIGMTEYFRALQGDQGKLELAADTLAVGAGDFFLVRSELDFHKPAEYDDLIEIGGRVLRFGKSSMQWQCEIHRGDEHLLTALMVYVHVDLETRDSKLLPQEFKEIVAGFEVIRPEGV